MFVLHLALAKIDHMGTSDTPANLRYPQSDQKTRSLTWNSFSRTTKEPKCYYDQYAGSCKVLTVQYNNDVTDEMEVDVAFKPTTRPKENKPVMQLFTLRFLDRLVTESQVEEYNLKQGNEFKCIHKVLR